MHSTILFSLFVVFAGAALLATAALWARQSLLVAYIVLGAALGPHALGVIEDASTVAQIGDVGIIVLLFLLGLHLHPHKLVRMLREAAVVTLASSAAFTLIGTGVALAFGFRWPTALTMGAAAMFSSTIIGLKLIPTTALHHRHMGEVVISILLLQDVLAIVFMLALKGLGTDYASLAAALAPLASFVLVIGAAFAAERFVLRPVLRRFDTIQEYVFLLALGWCLGLAQLAASIGLTHEIGAFVAGVTLAASPIARYIAESLKPLRDFFLVLFFFALGAGADLAQLAGVALPAAVLAISLLLAKPIIFGWLLRRAGERPDLSREVGARLGQLSEFALLISVWAERAGVFDQSAALVVQAATLLSFVASAYFIVWRFPTPLGMNAGMRRD